MMSEPIPDLSIIYSLYFRLRPSDLFVEGRYRVTECKDTHAALFRFIVEYEEFSCMVPAREGIHTKTGQRVRRDTTFIESLNKLTLEYAGLARTGGIRKREPQNIREYILRTADVTPIEIVPDLRLNQDTLPEYYGLFFSEIKDKIYANVRNNNKNKIDIKIESKT